MQNSPSFTVRARWIFPVERPPIRDGMLVVQNGRVAHVGPAPAGDTGTPWRNIAILPAFVNAHTHLEFSSLPRPLGSPAMPFTDWIRSVVEWRRARDTGPLISVINAPYLAAVRAGIDESLRAGVGTLGEVAALALSREAMRSSRASGVVYLELIGLAASSVQPLFQIARGFVATQASMPAAIRCGISPHAPYTVHPDLVGQIAELSAAEKIPVAMHLAETEAELQLLQDGTGPFADMLQALNAWHPDAIKLGSRPLDYLRLLAQSHRALVIHGNYLDDEEIRFLGEHRDHLSLAYCPRTHRCFGHPQYPLQKLLDSGVRVVLGTDSRASNPNLDLWAELRFAAEEHPGIAPETWLRMATLDGATALGLQSEYGSLVPGKIANFLAVQLPDDVTQDPWSWFYDEKSQIEQVYVGGG